MRLPKSYISGLCVTFALLALAGVVSGSCSRDECLENKSTIPKMGFYDASFPDQKVRLDSTAIYALGGPADSFILDSLRSAASVTLPLNLDADTTTLIFDYAQKQLKQFGVRDTVRLRYSRTPYFVSSACGVSYRIMVESVKFSKNIIDTVTVPEPLITNVEHQNVQVFFRIAHPEPSAPENNEESDITDNDNE